MNNIDIPAAVRAYIEAEWRGAGIIALNVAQAGIMTALQSADPKLSETAAERRFRKLVAEAVAANGGLPLNVVTKSTAETLALLQAISDATPAPVKPTKAEARYLRYLGMSRAEIIAAGRQTFRGVTVESCINLGWAQRLRTGGVELTDAGRALI